MGAGQRRDYTAWAWEAGQSPVGHETNQKETPVGFPCFAAPASQHATFPGMPQPCACPWRKGKARLKIKNGKENLENLFLPLFNQRLSPETSCPAAMPAHREGYLCHTATRQNLSGLEMAVAESSGGAASRKGNAKHRVKEHVSAGSPLQAVKLQ